MQVDLVLLHNIEVLSERVSYEIAGTDNEAVFIQGINKWSVWNTDLAALVRSVDYALIDATFYGDGELPGRDMSQVPHPLVTESMNALSELSSNERAKVWFIHFNHTNPLLNAQSAESKFVRSQGYNIATEGVRLPL